MSTAKIDVPTGYEALAEVFAAAMEQTAAGKGLDRHANGLPFDRQPMIEISKMVGVGFPLGQAQKKAQEAALLASAGEAAKARAEILGAINYLAGAFIVIRESDRSLW